MSLPPGWRLGRVSHVARAWVSNVDKHTVEGEARVRLCNYTDVYKNAVISGGMPFMVATASADQIHDFRLRQGDTVITKDSETSDDIGVPAFVAASEPDLICGYHLAILRPVSMHPRFLYWSLRSERMAAQWAVLAKGVTRVGLKGSDIRSASICIPPLKAQEAIAHYLDRETAQFDALIEKQQQLITTLEERFSAKLSRALSNPESKPGSWPTVPLKRAVTYQEGPGIMAEDFRDVGVPLLRVKSVEGPEATLDGCNYLDPSAVAQRWSHFRVQTGDILISASASLGSAAVVTESTEGSIPYTGIIRITPGRMVRDYLRWFVLSSHFRRQIDVLKTGTTIQHFGPSHLSQVMVKLPSEPVQREIADSLNQDAASANSLISGARELIALTQERRSTLITAAVTGQLDIRSAA